MIRFDPADQPKGDPGFTHKLTLVREEKDYAVYMRGRQKFITPKNLLKKRVSRPSGHTKKY